MIDEKDIIETLISLLEKQENIKIDFELQDGGEKNELIRTSDKSATRNEAIQ